MTTNSKVEDEVDSKLKDIKEFFKKKSVSQSSEERSEQQNEETYQQAVKLAHDDNKRDEDAAVLEPSMLQLSLSETSSDEYNSQHSSRGLCVVFNVENYINGKNKREGSHKDAEKLVETFKKLGFRCSKFNDPKKMDMIKFLKGVASLDHSNMDCVAVCILTHGDWITYTRLNDGKAAIADTLLAYDDEVKFSELTELFSFKNCHPSLRGKPKLFIIQACRGSVFAEGVKYEDRKSLNDFPQDAKYSSHDALNDTTRDALKGSADDTPKDSPQEAKEGSSQDALDDLPLLTFFEEDAHRQDLSLPEDMIVYKDFVVAWSTTPGYYSFRNSTNGSVFIQTLCQYLDEFHETSDLLSILTWVNSDVAHYFESNSRKPAWHQRKQMPWFFSRLTKDVYFRKNTDAVEI